MTAVLGLNLNHPDASAALILDGKVVAAVAEERFGKRIKHDPSFPQQAIRSVLSIGGISAKELDFIAVPRDTTPESRRQDLLRAAQSSRAAAWRRLGAYASGTIGRQRRRAGRALPASRRRIQVKAAVVNVEHHLSHIASSYYCSPFEGLTAGFSYDGSGDFVSAMAARCEGTRIEILDRVHLPNSLGFFYTACCQFIGFDEFGEEYKVMGLAPYGSDGFVDVMRELVETPSSDWFRLTKGFFGMHRGGEIGKMDEHNRLPMLRLYTDKWRDKLGAPRQRGEELTQRDKDIARSCQVRFEEVAVHCFKQAA